MNNLRLPYAEYWFPFQEYTSLDLTISIMRDLKIPELRTCFSWADWERPGGREWFDRFIGTLDNASIRLMPSVFYTPVDKAREKPGQETKNSFPPKRLEDFTDFVLAMLDRYGHTFEWMQLWNEPNWKVYWDQELDPDGKLYADMVDPALDVIHDAGKKAAIGGLSPYEPDWVERMHDFGVLQKADAVGIHAFPGTWDEGMDRRTDRPWKGTHAEIQMLREQLRSLGSHAQSWYTEIGYSTWGQGTDRLRREKSQIIFFDELIRCGADRAYWHTILDQHPDAPTDNELNANLESDERAYHFGVAEKNGKPKPLYFHWKNLAQKPS